MQCLTVVMHTGAYERIIWRSMLVTMKTSELFDQLLMIARLVEEAIRVCAKGPNRRYVNPLTVSTTASAPALRSTAIS